MSENFRFSKESTHLFGEGQAILLPRAYKIDDEHYFLLQEGLYLFCGHYNFKEVNISSLNLKQMVMLFKRDRKY